MSAYKQLLAKDIIVSPLQVSKLRQYNQDSFTENGIERLIGINENFDITGSTTGISSSFHKSLIYDSIKFLYYSNYISGSSGSTFERVSFNPDGTVTGPYYTPRFENYVQSTLTEDRSIPTLTNSTIGVISIPRDLFGDYIKPGTFTYITEFGIIEDNGQGYLISGSNIIGTIQYSHGLATIVSSSTTQINPEFQLSSSYATCSFAGLHTVYETGYYCTINENEYNYTLNSSTFSSSNGDIRDTLTGSNFQPYVTTVGLYNEQNECLLVAKLAQPVQIPQKVNLTIRINVDI